LESYIRLYYMVINFYSLLILKNLLSIKYFYFNIKFIILLCQKE
jgi:hypothetical protein